MIKIYGSMLCRDCVQCCEDLNHAKIEYQFLDFADSLANLKAFLKLRETLPVFIPVIENGSIGIPCLVLEDGTVLLDWEALLK